MCDIYLKAENIGVLHKLRIWRLAAILNCFTQLYHLVTLY